jgi:transposase
MPGATWWTRCRHCPRTRALQSSLAAQFIELIAKLYAVESQGARELEMDAQQRLEHRQLHSVPVIKAIETLLLTNLHAVVPGSALGKALHYLSGHPSSTVNDVSP